MAMTKHTVMNAKRNEAGDSITFETIGADGKYVEWKLRDERTVILVKNADSVNDATVTIAKGDGINGPESDLVLTVAKSTTIGFTLDSSRYMQQGKTTAADKGRVKFTTSDTTDVSIAVIALG